MAHGTDSPQCYRRSGTRRRSSLGELSAHDENYLLMMRIADILFSPIRIHEDNNGIFIPIDLHSSYKI